VKLNFVDDCKFTSESGASFTWELRFGDEEGGPFGSISYSQVTSAGTITIPNDELEPDSWMEVTV